MEGNVLNSTFEKRCQEKDPKGYEIIFEKSTADEVFEPLELLKSTNDLLTDEILDNHEVGYYCEQRGRYVRRLANIISNR